MQTCSYCGAELPENARFCGKCGSKQDALATDAATSRSTTPATWPLSGTYPAQGSAPTWSPNVQAPGTPPLPLAAENEDERRRGIAPWSPLYDAALGADALLGSGQASTPGAPVVQGTPQIGSVPSVAGSPTPDTNAPVGHPAQGPTYHNPSTYHLQMGPQQTYEPPGQPGTQGYHTPPEPHGPQPTHEPPAQTGTQQHQTPPEPHAHHAHLAQHAHQPAAHVTTAAGGSAVKTIMVVVTTVVVVAAGGIGAAAYFLSRPQPLISVTSTYKVGNALAGATGTILQISGQKFSSNSAITFLLDGQVAPGNPGTRSDANGNFRAEVTITDAWSVGTHTLTARDASNYRTKNSVRVTVVQPGQANTPGPNGAPPDDASFKVIAQIQGSQFTETEVVTGHPDPMGGTVCQPQDNGQPVVSTGFSIPGSNAGSVEVPYRETSTYSCAGSYKGGKLTLTETFTSDVFAFSLPDGTTTTCTLNSSRTDEKLSGSYTGNNTFSGTVTYPTIPDSDYPCNGDGSFSFYSFHQSKQNNWNWTGQVTDLHIKL